MDKNRALLSIGLCYLSGLVRLGTVNIEDVMRFLADPLVPPDQMLHPESFPEVMNELKTLAVEFGNRCPDRASARKMIEVLNTFGSAVAGGNITPITLAILCNCGVSDFEAILEGSQRGG